MKSKLEQEADRLKNFEHRLAYRRLDEIVDDLVTVYDPDRPEYTTGFPTFDQDLAGRLKGNVAAYIGYGGTRKSLAALLCAYRNTALDARSIYSSMEMPAYKILERIIDLTLDQDQTVERGSTFIRKEYRMDSGTLERLRKTVKEAFGPSIVVTTGRRMQCEDYEAIILKYSEEQGKKPDILIVDGLSMMGSDSDREVEAYTTNSGELKDLANQYDLFIPLICHCSKGKTLHDRHLLEVVRGSEKILDNVDFMLQFSLLPDVQGEKGVYRDDCGWVRMWNKRGSGSTIDITYAFDRKTLNMTEDNSFKDNEKNGW